MPSRRVPMAEVLSSAEEEEDLGAPEEPPFPCELPAGQRQDWPAPSRAVLGPRGVALAWIESALARAALSSLAHLPLALRSVAVGTLARAAKALDRRRSEAARVFLRQALGSGPSDGAIDGRVLQAWRHLFDVTLDAEALHRRAPLGKIREHFDVELCADAQRIVASKMGSILATAHVGDWETGSAGMPWIGFQPFYVGSEPAQNRPPSVPPQSIPDRPRRRV